MAFDKCLITCFTLIPFVISLQCDTTTKGKVKIAECKNLGLTEVPQCLPTDINILDLSGNNIENLYNNAFGPYRLLEELILKKNKIHHIEENSFFGLNRLNVLNMSENNLNLLHS
ncbi:Hypothetical predicted protein [Mytilus galloprovincialis]|uniref:Uncharacterized protein n=1 Tax=Mytilus galloprovincialis TaxID=29158 RepID=A0A8B6CSS5_MYTGA|nr:Hypothetical predicted protein [Mytilus galloprovincialis]